MSDKDVERKLSFLDNGIAQVAIIVEDLETAVENYWRLFGIGDSSEKKVEKARTEWVRLI